jgi:hypothetical protein
MVAVHGLKIDNGDYDGGAADSNDERLSEENGPPLKKRKATSSGNRAAASQTVALLRWLVGSYHPLDLVHTTSAAMSGFVNFCRSLNGSFCLPPLQHLVALADQRYRELQDEIRHYLNDKECGFLSVSVRRVKVRCISKHDDTPNSNVQDVRWYFPVQFTFCTSNFEKKSLTAAVVKRETDEGGPINENDAFEQALAMFNVDKKRVTWASCLPSQDGDGFGSVEGSRIDDTDSQMTVTRCVVDQMDEMVMNCTQTFLKNHFDGEFNLQESTHDSTQIQRSWTHRMYQLIESANEKEMEGQTLAIARVHLLKILAPFKDAIETLSSDPYPTVGLAISVLRRVQRVLGDVDLSSRLEPSVEGSDNQQKMKEVMEDFLHATQSNFHESFKPFLREDAHGLWTVPLDPRLVLMNGLSENEQDNVKSSLCNAVRDFIQEKMQHTDPTIARRDKNGFGPSASTMDGLFLGDAINDSHTSVEDAEAYAKSNVESFFLAVSSHRQINDSLQWWKNHHSSFPELSCIARKWLTTSTIYAGPTVNSDERNAIIPINYENEEDIVRAIFLHDNEILI